MEEVPISFSKGFGQLEHTTERRQHTRTNAFKKIQSPVKLAQKDTFA